MNMEQRDTLDTSTAQLVGLQNLLADLGESGSVNAQDVYWLLEAPLRALRRMSEESIQASAAIHALKKQS